MAAARYFCSPLVALKCSSHHLSVPGRRSNNCEKSISSTRFLSTEFRKCRAVCAKADAFRHGRTLSTSSSSRVRAAAAAGGDEDGAAADSSATKGRQLWRSELDSASELSSEFESLDGAALERDIERFTKKEEMERLWSQAARSNKNEQAPDQRGGGVRDVVDKLLVADFFFILFILAWLLTGLAERAALDSTTLIDSWLPLWPSVFQPALGVFMAGAIVSAITKKK